MFDLKGFRQAFSLTQKQLADLFECKQSNISGMEKSMRDLESYQKDILINNYGESSLDKFVVSSPLGKEENKADNINKLDTYSKTDYKLVPIIHIDSVGGIHSNNDIVGEPQYIEGYIPFTDAKDGDICIIQSGNSMTPTCPSGSLLLLRKVLNWREYFGFGSIFVIELSDGRRITKEVSRYDENPKDYIWCISHNPNVPDEELPKSMIVSVWKVIKIQIDKGW